MKKAMILLCTVLIIVVTGCGNTQLNAAEGNKDNHNGNNPPADSMNLASEAKGDEAEQNDIGEQTFINGIISDYNITRTSFEKNSNDIEIFFPAINGLSDEAKQYKINDLIRNAALADTQGDIDQYSAFDLNYTIKWSSNNLLSILFYGYYNAKQAPHPNRIFNAVNIDMKTGDIIKLSDIVNIDNDFVNGFIEKSQFVDGGATLDFTEIKNDFFDADDLKISFENDAAYYFTSTGLVLRVSTVYAIGDYAFFHLDFSDISNDIKQKSQWEDIKPDFPVADFQIIREQCFQTEMAGFGTVWFVSGCDQSSNGILQSFKFYLLDNSGRVTYTFPDFNSSDQGYFGIRAVAFSDVNHDGYKDVILIAALQNEELEDDEAKIFIRDHNDFKMDKELNVYIEENLNKAKTAAEVMAAAKKYFK